MEAMNMKKKDPKIVVAVDESDESMYALSWCLTNLISQTSTTNLVLLYVKLSPPVYSSLDAASKPPLLLFLLWYFLKNRQITRGFLVL